MAATTDQTFWGFLWWIKHNPFKSIEAMNTDDLDEMAKQFAAVNVTAGTLSLTDPGSYGTLDFPKKGTSPARYATDGNGVAAAQTVAACEQSLYPEQALGS
ncbi:MAG: hypothetical protein PHF37_03270 [Phycisphaerae bacterium]|jgi:hypothetical protein|nr:hypothetical protein [Phycisphaerae bacterium]